MLKKPRGLKSARSPGLGGYKLMGGGSRTGPGVARRAYGARKVAKRAGMARRKGR